MWYIPRTEEALGRKIATFEASLGYIMKIPCPKNGLSPNSYRSASLCLPYAINPRIEPGHLWIDQE